LLIWLTVGLQLGAVIVGPVTQGLLKIAEYWFKTQKGRSQQSR